MGRKGNAPVQSLEPPGKSQSITSIAPGGWQPNSSRGLSLIVSPDPNMQQTTLSLKDQLSQVKNSMNKQLQFQQAQINRSRVPIQSPRPAPSAAKNHDGPTQMSSKMGSSQDTAPSSMLTSNHNQSKIKFPMTSYEALNLLGPYLWEAEKKELAQHEFEIVYYFNI